MTRKFLPMILAVSMAVCLCMVSALAAVPTYAAQSAQSSIDRWASYGVIDASDPTLEAESELTYARLAEILVKLLKLPSAGASFGTDSSITDAIRRCAAAGLLDTDENGSVKADAAISSDKAMLVLGRALGLEPVKNTKLKNSSGMDSETKGMIAALVQAGVVSESQVSTTSNASLGSVASILDRAIGTYANEDGAKVNVSESKGITLIVANNVTVSGSADTIVVASNNGSVKLDGVSAEKVAVTGKSAKVELNNAEAKSVVASGTKAAIETKGETKVEALAVTGSEAAVKTADNTTVGSFTVNANNATVTTEGNTKVEKLSVEGTKVEVKTAGETSVGSLTVNAKNSSITTEGNTKVEALAVGGSEVEVKTAGETSVGTLTVSAKNSTVTTEGNTKVEALAVEGSDVAVKTTGETSVGSLTVSADNASVTTEGNTKVESLAVAGANASVEAKGSAKIEAVAVDEKATGTTVSAGSGTTISAIENKAENTTVTGSGKVESVTSSKDVTVETSGTQISNSGKGEIAVTDSSGQASSVTTGESANAHVHSYRASTVSPTCTEAGATVYTCTCGNSYSEPIAALGHNFNETGVCTRCDAVTDSVVAVIGKTGYTSLNEAVAASQDGNTVVVMRDIALTQAVEITKSITLDTNGKNITAENVPALKKFDASGAISIYGEGVSANVTGSGKISTTLGSGTVLAGIMVTGGATAEISDLETDLSGTSNNIVLYVYQKGTMNVRNGSYLSTGGGTCVSAYGSKDAVIHIYGGDFDTKGDAGPGCVWANKESVITIYDGTFHSDPLTRAPLKDGETLNAVYCLFDYNGMHYDEDGHVFWEATVDVRGGTFKDFNPTGGNVGVNTNFVAEGYEVKVTTKQEDDGEHKYYTVVPKASSTVDEEQ